MAHFGVQKAKKMLVLAGVAAVAGASLVSVGNAGAISDLTNGTDYDCDSNGHDIILKSANGIKWAVKDQEEFYKESTTNCYADWEGNVPISHNLKFYINSGDYSFDELITREDGAPDSRVFIANNSNVSFSATSDEAGLYSDGYSSDGSATFRVPFEIEEGSSLVINSGKYSLDITSYRGDLTINGGTFENLDVYNNNGNVTINDGKFSTNNAVLGGSHFMNAGAESVMTVKDGSFSGEEHSYSININPNLFENSGTLTIEGGDFKYDFTNTAGIGYEDMPYYGDPGAMIRNSGQLKISGGNFGGPDSGKGTLINQYNDTAKTEITGGNFEVESMFTSFYLNDEESSSKLDVKGGTFNTRKTFYLVDYKDKLPHGQAPAEGGNAYGLWVDSDDQVRSGYATGPSTTSPYILGSITDRGLKGGDYSDGEHVTPATGYDKIDLDSDFDGDGNKDIRILEKEGDYPMGVSVPVGGEKSLNLGMPGEGEWRIYEIGNDRCSATVNDGQITFTGLKSTNGDSSQFCWVTVVSDSKIRKYSVSVFYEESYKDGAPLSIPTGETKTPDDFEGNPDDFEWRVIEGEEFCTVNEKGEITAVKGGGSCTIEAYNPVTKEHITWEVKTTNPIEMEVGDTKKPEDLPEGYEDGEWSSDDAEVCTVAEDGTITAKKAGTCHVTLKLTDGSVYTWAVNIKANPNTLDKKQAIAFSIAGAAIAGIGAMIASIKRFGRR